MHCIHAAVHATLQVPSLNDTGRNPAAIASTFLRGDRRDTSGGILSAAAGVIHSIVYDTDGSILFDIPNVRTF